MIDSCVGGKSSINVSHFKNLIGNIYPPREIVINTGLIDSLPPDEYLCGLAEGVKICFAKGEKQFRDFIENPAAHLQGDSRQLEDLVGLSLRSKIWFVEIDEYDLLVVLESPMGLPWQLVCWLQQTHSGAN
jgi:3-dehydroquinate synthase